LNSGLATRPRFTTFYARAVALGFELCPGEVGPALRLNYVDQPPGDFLHIAMKPVAKYNGALINFTVAKPTAALASCFSVVTHAPMGCCPERIVSFSFDRG
jgi:hypothetical protein